MKKDKAKLEVEILEGIYEELLSLQNQIFAICLMMKKKGINKRRNSNENGKM